MEDGLRLGPVGGRIVGEVFIGLLKADDTSYLAAQPNWTPVLPSATPGEFHMTDLLTFAGVVPPLELTAGIKGVGSLHCPERARKDSRPLCVGHTSILPSSP